MAQAGTVGAPRGDIASLALFESVRLPAVYEYCITVLVSVSFSEASWHR